MTSGHFGPPPTDLLAVQETPGEVAPVRLPLLGGAGRKVGNELAGLRRIRYRQRALEQVPGIGVDRGLDVMDLHGGGLPPTTVLAELSGAQRESSRCSHKGGRVAWRCLAHGRWEVQMADREFLSVKEAAELLGMSQATIRRRIKKGMIKAYRLRGGRRAGSIRIRRADLLDALEPLQPKSEATD